VKPRPLGGATATLDIPASLLLATVVAGIAIRVAIGVWATPDPLIRDQAGYWALAQGLLERGELAFVPGRPTALRTPGYPLFLAAILGTFGPSVRAVLIVNGLLGALGLWWMHRTLVLLEVRGLGQWLGMLALGFYPPILHALHGVYSEGLALPLMALVLYLWARHYRSDRRLDLVWLGLATGVSTMVRPAALLLVPALAVATLGARRRLDVVGWALALALSLAPPGLWTLRNAAHGLGRGVETFSGFQAYASVVSLEADFDAAHAVPIADWEETCRLANKFFSERVGRPVELPLEYPVSTGALQELEIQQQLNRRTLELIRQRPADYLASFPRRFLILWADIGNRTYENRLYLNAMAMLLVVALVVASFLWPVTRAAPITWLGAVCFAYVTVLSLPFSVSDRYTWPSLLAMFPCATNFVATVLASLWGRTRS
jgi:Dolichyl-phosphate-mannose-protein mannosyltransferase